VRRRNIFVALITLALVAVMVVRVVARRLVFRTERATSTALPADAELETMTARDGVLVHALELPAATGARVVVHFHNNSETMAGPIAMARAIHAHGLGVVLVEYRGYGLSAGSPEEEGLYADAEAVLDALEARGVARDRVVLSGTSLGTGVAAEMARRSRGAALVLVSPYTSIADLVTNVVPFAPASLLVPDRFDTLAKASAIGVPTLIIHGDADAVVPFSMGERVASAIRGARFVRVAGGGHGDGDLFAREGERLVTEVVRLSSLQERGGTADLLPPDHRSR
jgi:fermentation-respiration switch protein FrsA (DUF1100 family)